MSHGTNKGQRKWFGTDAGRQKAKNRAKPKPKPIADSKKHDNKSHTEKRRGTRSF